MKFKKPFSGRGKRNSNERSSYENRGAAPEEDVKIYPGKNRASTQPSNKKKKKKNKSRKRIVAFRILKISLVVIILAAIGVTAFSFTYVRGIAQDLPEWTGADMTGAMTSTFYDKDGNEIARRHGEENRYPVELSEVPDVLIEAFLATEDTEFYDHPGISISGIVRSAIVNIQRGRIAQGASTITQQLARNALLDEDIRYARSWDRKVTEILLALQLENQYTKNEILEMYLNTIPFGQGAYGVQAASQTYFDKDVGDLNLEEAALLAGLPQRPSSYNPFRNPDTALARRSQVLQRMKDSEYISEMERIQADNTGLDLAEPASRAEAGSDAGRDYVYFIDHAIDEAEEILEETGYSPDIYRHGYKIYTTMNTPVQRHIEELFRDPDNFPKDMNDEKVQAALIMIDHHTGAIQGMMGGREAVGERTFNRATSRNMRRQPGSATKPIFSYAPAIEYDGKGPATVYDDMPFEIQTAQGPYRPRNFDGRYRGLVTMREALQRSINIPAVIAMHETGVPNAFDFAANLGFPLLEGERNNLSLALGGMEHGVNPLDLARAFGAFANEGIQAESYSVTRIEDRNGNVIYETNPQQKEVMSEETAYLTTDMLRSVVEAGTGTRARIPGWNVAGKTGTTQLPRSTPAERQMFSGISGTRDAWFAGYTSRYTAAVWMGFDQTTREHYLPGVQGGQHPASLFQKAMAFAHEDLEPSGFNRPDSIVSIAIDQKSGLLPSELTPTDFIRRELFHRNHVPTETSDVWEEVEVCEASGLRTTEFCPDPQTEVFLKRDLPEDTHVTPMDYDLAAPDEECTWHTVPRDDPDEEEENGNDTTVPEPGNGQEDNDTEREDPDEEEDIFNSMDIRGTETGPVLEWELDPPYRNREFEFRIFRQKNTDADMQLLETTTDTSFQDVTVEAGNEYFYIIEATEKRSGDVYRSGRVKIIY